MGDESLLDELPGDLGREDSMGPYAKVLPDGRQVTSVSAASELAAVPRDRFRIGVGRRDPDPALEAFDRFLRTRR